MMTTAISEGTRERKGRRKDAISPANFTGALVPSGHIVEAPEIPVSNKIRDQRLAQESALKLVECLQGDLKLTDDLLDALALTVARVLHCFEAINPISSERRARNYLKIAESGIEALDKIGVEDIITVVEPGMKWPVRTDASPMSFKIIKSKLLRLGVYRKRPPSVETAEVSVAHWLYGVIRIFQEFPEICRDFWPVKGALAPVPRPDELVGHLGALSRENYAAWWNCGAKLLEKFYGKHFEENERFLHYWKSDAYKGFGLNAKRAAIRRDIKRSIKQAFRSIAPR